MGTSWAGCPPTWLLGLIRGFFPQKKWPLHFEQPFRFRYQGVRSVLEIWDIEASNRKLFLQKQPSHLENLFSKFSFSSRNMRKEYPFLFLFSQKENLFANFSFSSRNWDKEFQISLLFSKFEIFFKFLFLLSKPENRKCHSLSLLKSGESFYKFLFFFSKLEKGIS